MIRISRNTRPRGLTVTRPRDSSFLEDKSSESKLLLKDIQKTAGLKTQRDAYTALRAVIQVLRDHLPIHDAVEFGSQLPLVIRGMYYESWNPDHKLERLDSAEQFLSEIAHHPGGNASGDPREITKGVLMVLDKHMAATSTDIKLFLPQEIVRVWNQDPWEIPPSPQDISQHNVREEADDEKLLEREQDEKTWNSERDFMTWDHPD